MGYWHSVNYLIPQKSFKLLLNKNLSIITNARFIKSSKCFIPSLQGSNYVENIKNSRHVQLTLSQNLIEQRKFSSSKTVLANKGPNKAKMDKQVMMLSVVIVSVSLLCLYLLLTMEYHQDYVIIENENNK